MVDPVGAALGVAGLAGLFSTCVQGFQLLQLGRHYAQDFDILQTKFEAQKVRFLIWGETFGFLAGQRYDVSLDSPSIRPTIVRILNNIRLLFSDETKLRRRYGLRPDTEELPPSGRVIFQDAYRRFQARLVQTQRRTGPMTKCKWAISDKQKFADLLQHVKDLLDSLIDISSSIQALSQQRARMVIEVESINDAHSLELLERASTDDQISDAASRRLREIRSERAISSIHPTFSSGDSFHTAPSQNLCNEQEQLVGTNDDPCEESAQLIPQHQRIIHQIREAVRRTERVLPFGYPLRRVDANTGASESEARVLLPKWRSDALFPGIKDTDEKHARDVVKKFAQTSDPNERRMISILQNNLDSTPTSFVSLTPIGDGLFNLLGRVKGPDETPYAAGIFDVLIKIPPEFPRIPPNCRFLTRIYHPNIDPLGNICLDVLQHESWRTEMMYLEPILISISALLDIPNIDDPLVPEIAGQFIRDRERYDEIAQEYTRVYAFQNIRIANISAVTGGPKLPPEKLYFLQSQMTQLRGRTSKVIDVLYETQFWKSRVATDVSRKYVRALQQLATQLADLERVLKDTYRVRELDQASFDKWENLFDICDRHFHEFVHGAMQPKGSWGFSELLNEYNRGIGRADVGKFADPAPS